MTYFSTWFFSLACTWILVGLSQGEASESANPRPEGVGESQHTLLDETLNWAKGHREFQELYFKQYESEFVKLVKEGQSPKTLFIGCSDSRVVPDLILNARPGDLFVIRTAGNFVSPCEFQWVDGVAATIQYAVEGLNVSHIIVCGHSHCGAIKALFQENDPKKFDLLNRWLKLGERAKRMTLLTANDKTSKEDLYATTEEISVIFQLDHLMTFPFIKKRVQEGKLQLHGWYFKIETGEVFYYNSTQYRFLPLSDKIASTITTHHLR